MFQPDQPFGNDQLIAQLARTPYYETWRTRGTDRLDYVLRLFPAMSSKSREKQWAFSAFPYAVCHSKDQVYSLIDRSLRDPVAALQMLPPIPNTAPLLACETAEYDDNPVFIIRRRFYPRTLIEAFPPDATRPPSRALLEAFSLIAVALDTLQAQSPNLVLDLSPYDLLLEHDSPIISDYGLSVFEHYDAFNNRLPPMRARLNRGVPLLASYPSYFEGILTPVEPQFTLAALYVYLRSGFQLLEEPDSSSSAGDDGSKLPSMELMIKLDKAEQHYKQKRQMPLRMLPDETERQLVQRATSRESAQRFESAVAFAAALRTLDAS